MTDQSQRFTVRCAECGTPHTSFAAHRLPADGDPRRRQWVAVVDCQQCSTMTCAIRPRQKRGTA